MTETPEREDGHPSGQRSRVFQGLRAAFARARPVLRVAIMVVVAAAFAWYLVRHPELGRQLLQTPVRTLVLLLFLYVVWFAALVFTVYATLRLCRQPLPLSEHVLVNAYSTLANFFIPGQAGIAVRGLYLKRGYGLPVHRYVFATLVYYACYALVSVLLLLMEVVPAWQTIVGIVAVGAVGAAALRWYARRSRNGPPGLHVSVTNLVVLVLATLVQAAVQVSVYGVELRAVDPGVAWSQVITYTGAANFSLFVALTPGAIGIREAFLLFTRGLHHIATASIVAAALMDRAVFLVLLGLLFVTTLALHARRRFRTD